MVYDSSAEFSTPFLKLCGVLKGKQLQLPFSNATVRIKFAKPESGSNELSAEEMKGIKVLFKAIQVEKIGEPLTLMTPQVPPKIYSLRLHCMAVYIMLNCLL